MGLVQLCQRLAELRNTVLKHQVARAQKECPQNTLSYLKSDLVKNTIISFLCYKFVSFALLIKAAEIKGSAPASSFPANSEGWCSQKS